MLQPPPMWGGPHPANHLIPQQLALKGEKMEPPGADEEPVKCACGRPLRDPLSRSRGLGPVCWRRLHTPTTPVPAPSTRPVPPVDGQLALDIPAFIHVPAQPRLSRDLREQLTYQQRRRITTIPTGSYL